jgi:hypothetical protein
MQLGTTLGTLMALARIALASIVLVVVPLADAATCAGETVAGEIEVGAASGPSEVAVQITAGDVGHDSQLPGDAQHCIHGHCHHATTLKDGESISQVLAVGAISVEPLRTDMVLAHMSAGPERPPKA